MAGLVVKFLSFRTTARHRAFVSKTLERHPATCNLETERPSFMNLAKANNSLSGKINDQTAKHSAGSYHDAGVDTDKEAEGLGPLSYLLKMLIA